MKTTIKKIGNSRGLIIPLQILKECGFTDEVSLEIKGGNLVVSSAQESRAGWEKAFIAAGIGKESPLLPDMNNDFDREEWTW